MNKVYGDEPPSYDVVKHWRRQFKYGGTSVEISPIRRRPHSAIDSDTVYKVEATILEDCRITFRQLAQELKITVGTVEKIIHDQLLMRRLSARWIPRMLTPFQQQERVNCFQALLAMYEENEEDIFGRFITQSYLSL
ncbi:protein GVQW3-like [Octopus bimaculoides]|uniref:protein GVQW3-like n=1 Tax=Octopus bimaculoides TaxID=37653 RepID=UPI00071DA932|nr:protein GVQW3-like [Octopus bimaculoides]|eukprot:XP_014767990.1 PREDICTED: putative uncharacterized protein FLJ37770 [Octopus bimaculoides]